jgi:hypothetical protein
MNLKRKNAGRSLINIFLDIYQDNEINVLKLSKRPTLLNQPNQLNLPNPPNPLK